MSEAGSPLQEYREVGKQISEKLGTDWIDSINLIEINEKNYETYLLDEVHPNFDGIYLISDTVIRYFAGEIEADKEENE